MAKNIIMLNRGDSKSIFIAKNEAYVPFCPHDCCLIDTELSGNDALYFGVMLPHQPFEDALIRKKFTVADYVDGYIELKLEPEDTVHLFPGIYYYSVKIDRDSGVTTVIDKKKFILND